MQDDDIREAEDRLFAIIESDTVSEEFRARASSNGTKALSEHLGEDFSLADELAGFERGAADGERRLESVIDALREDSGSAS